MVRMSRKDKNKPRGRMSSYAFFVQDCRRNAGGSVNFAQFSKACAQEWNSLSQNEKRQYEEMAKRDKQRYDREMKGYVPPPGMARKKRRMKDPSAPKRPLSAFLLFSSEHRPRIMRSSPSMGVTDVARQLGKLWNGQSQRDRAPFEEKAGQLRQRYEVQMRAYRARGGPKRFKAQARLEARKSKSPKRKAGRRKVGRRKAGRRKAAPKRRGAKRRAGKRRASSKRRAPKRRAGSRRRSRSRSRSGSRGRR